MQVLSTHVSDKRGTDALKRALADIDAPGWCVAFGDRPDMLKAALDERYKGKKIVHVGGGETVHYQPHAHPDHWTRDAISMISSLHFVANDLAAAALREIGLKDVHVTGCPSLDEVVAYKNTLDPMRKRDGVFTWLPESVDGFKPNTGHRLSEQDFLHRIAHCELFRTNSSAGLREAPILGTRVEMVGDRQRGRIQGPYHNPKGRACEEIARICKKVCK